jgi:hypothetical protein
MVARLFTELSIMIIKLGGVVHFLETWWGLDVCLRLRHSEMTLLALLHNAFLFQTWWWHIHKGSLLHF